MRAGGARAPWIAALLLLLLHAAHAALLAVDLGNESIKLAIVKGGKTPISIVTNEMSRRKSPALIGFVNGERLVGEEAISVQARYPTKIVSRLRDMMGAQADDPALQDMLKRTHRFFDLERGAERGTVVLPADDGVKYSAEEMMAGIFTYAAGLAAAANDGQPVTDCAVAVPAYMTQPQRQAIIDAAKLAGLKVLSVLNSHAGAALQYGIERTFPEKELILFYDMGASSTEVALVEFSTFGAAKTGQFVVLDVAWDETLGGEELDRVMVEHFAAEFEKKHGVDITRNPKSMAKMYKQCKRVKEILSVNTDARLTVEEVHDGIDFFSEITRSTLEELAAPILARVGGPIKEILARRPDLKPTEQLTNVELLGGGTRVPAVQAAISEALGGRQTDRHLDADEAVVMGAALNGANVSTSFRLRKFGMGDGSPYAFEVTFTSPDAPAEDEAAAVEAAKGDDDAEAAEASGQTMKKRLLPRLKTLPAKRMVTVPWPRDPVEAELRYVGGAAPHVPEGRLARFTLTGADEIHKQRNTTGRVKAYFTFSNGGMVELDRVESVVEVTEMVETKVPRVLNETANATANATNATETVPTEGADADAGKDESPEQPDAEVKPNAESGAESDGADGAASDKSDAEGDGAGGQEEPGEGDGDTPSGDEGAEQDAKKDAKEGAKEDASKARSKKREKPQKPEVVYDTVKKPRQRVHRKRLTVVGGPHAQLGGMTAAERKEAAARLQELARRDAVKRETAKAKNDLESFIITVVDKLEMDEAVVAVTTEDQRSKLQAELTAIEDWLYSDGDSSSAAEFRKQLALAHGAADGVLLRAAELTARPEALAEARGHIARIRNASASWAESKPWITDKERADLEKQLDALEAWLTQQEEAQAKLEATADPAFVSKDVSERLVPVHEAFKKLDSRPKPKPKKESKKEEGEKKEDEKEKKGGWKSWFGGRGKEEEEKGKGKEEGEEKEGAQEKEGREQAEGGEQGAARPRRGRRARAPRRARAAGARAEGARARARARAGRAPGPRRARRRPRGTMGSCRHRANQ
ncbi:unnamed protein product [Pedinophyceae sp. YPF-701]|nr:unnamed protein product [Pedinophyceae sp. YPF-701]